MFALEFATQAQQMKAMETHQELPGRIHVVLIGQQIGY